MGDQVAVVALSRAPAGRILWQRPPNAPVLTIVSRATFVLQPGDAVLASQQEALTIGEQSYPDGSSLGIYAASDLVPMKPRADVVLVGHAFAPGGNPVRSLVARLAVGEMEKRIEVFCDRRFDRNGALLEGARFTSMPLVYERAAGGPDTVNPLGVRPQECDERGRVTLPNLQAVGLEITSPADLISPVGFGPIASDWPSRRALLGPLAQGQSPAEWQGPVVPLGLDPSHFHAAPYDQQVQALRGDERIVLTNLHPSHPELVMRLSGVRPRTFVTGRPGAPQSVTMRADTLWIDTSRQIFTITWRGQLPLDPGSPDLRVIVALEWPDRPFTWEDIERIQGQAAAAKAADASRDQTIAANVPPSSPTLPFAGSRLSVPAPRESGSGIGLPFHAPGAAAPPPLITPPSLPVAPLDGRLMMTLPTTPQEALRQLPAPVPAPIDSLWARGGSGLVPAPSLWSSPPRDEPAEALSQTPLPAVALPAPSSRPEVAPSPARASDPLHLLWLEPDSFRYLGEDPRFSPIFDALEQQPLDDDLDDPDLAADPAERDERREALEILAGGSALGEEAILAELAGAVQGDGGLVQPLVLVAGELVFAFDAFEALKATISTASPYAGANPEARAILDLARELLGSPGQPSAPGVAEGLATRIRDTFEKQSLLPAGFLDKQTEHALLRGRHYQRRAVLGGPHVRAMLHPGPGQGIPAYLDIQAAMMLPAVCRIRTRMLVVVHPAVDQYEAHPAALRVIALGVVHSPLARR